MTKGLTGKEPDPREVYADIIGHPHHVSDHHPAMSLYDRAAQFSAYKALSGYEDMVNEEARTVDQMMEPGEDQVSELNAQLQALTPGTAAVITFFVPDPLKAGGKLVVIDGGFCRAYQKTTGIAGYTLIANSHCMRLMSHQPFTNLKDARETGRDIHSQSFEFATYPAQLHVRDTDHGRHLQQRMEDLMTLLDVSRRGLIPLGK